MKNWESLDENILLSIINMKLRNYYSSLIDLCDDLQIDQKKLEAKLATVNYYYQKTNNQFVYQD